MLGATRDEVANPCVMVKGATPLPQPPPAEPAVDPSSESACESAAMKDSFRRLAHRYDGVALRSEGSPAPWND